jgi:hypothetical protein
VNEYIEHGAGPSTPEHVRRDNDDEKDSEKPPEWAKGQGEIVSVGDGLKAVPLQRLTKD